MTQPQVTVAVPVKDRRDQMLRCLDALLAQDHPSYEILVLDNGSTDGTGDACRERAATAKVPVRVVTVEGRLGRVRNHAGELASGEVIAFTDSDCLPAPGWLRAGTAVLAADPGVGIVCGQTLPEEPVTAGWASTVEITDMTWRFESCNIFFRTAAFRASAGFDEAVGDGWEDTAAGFSLLEGGWRAAFAPDALVRHDVTYPGFWWHVRREQRQRRLPRVVRRFPQTRRRLLFARVFFRERSARFYLALIGVALAPRRPAAIALSVPYAAFLARDRPDPRAVAQAVVYDAATCAAILRGAVQYRSFVL